MAAREESGDDSCEESDLGGLGRGLGQAGFDEGDGESRFLTAAGRRFGMTEGFRCMLS